MGQPNTGSTKAMALGDRPKNVSGDLTRRIRTCASIVDQRGLGPPGSFNERCAFDPILSIAEVEEGGPIGKTKLL